MPFGQPDTFEVKPPSPWPATPVVNHSPKTWKDDEQKKKQFAIELTRKPNAFEAACVIFADTKQALWASQNWITDPIVIASKVAYNAAEGEKLLDKDDLSRELLAFSKEKDLSGRFYLNEAKDRLAALKLYAEVQGFIGKVEVDASTKNFTNNVMKIVLVGTKKPNDTLIENEPSNDDVQQSAVLPSNIKLVSAR